VKGWREDAWKRLGLEGLGVWGFGGWRVIGLEGGCVEEVRREWS